MALYIPALYLFGIAGALALGYIPARLLRLIRRQRGRVWTMPGVISLFAISGALLVECHFGYKVAACLVGNYCGPNISSGWIYLAMIGLGYLVMEGCLLVLRAVESGFFRGSGNHS